MATTRKKAAPKKAARKKASPPHKHEPTEESRKLVANLARVGTPQDSIAPLIGITEKTLRAHYRVELDEGLEKANAMVAGSLYEQATNGHVGAQAFWLKTQAKWRESGEDRDSDKDIPERVTVEVVNARIR